MLNIGFAVDNLGANQFNYSFLKEANAYVSNNLDVCVHVFSKNTCLPCLQPLFGRYYIKDADLFKGHIFCSSLQLLNDIKRCQFCEKYLYIYDIIQFQKELEKLGDEVFKNDVHIFARCKDYKELIKELGYKILDEIVEFPSIQNLKRIIKNGSKVS